MELLNLFTNPKYQWQPKNHEFKVDMFQDFRIFLFISVLHNMELRVHCAVWCGVMRCGACINDITHIHNSLKWINKKNCHKNIEHCELRLQVTKSKKRNFYRKNVTTSLLQLMKTKNSKWCNGGNGKWDKKKHWIVNLVIHTWIFVTIDRMSYIEHTMGRLNTKKNTRTQKR